jgi:hypothetical protein
VEQGHGIQENAKIYQLLALQLNMEKRREEGNEEFSST